MSFVVPSAMGRVMIMTPIVLALADRVGFAPGGRGRAGMVLATALGTMLPAYGILPSNVPNMAMMGAAATIYDLEEAELCYAPQFGSAKDPVNFAGMVAANIMEDGMPVSHWDELEGAFLLDVRQPVELVIESVPGAVNIPIGQLRSRMEELPKDKEIHLICRSAQRAMARALAFARSTRMPSVLSPRSRSQTANGSGV